MCTSNLVLEENKCNYKNCEGGTYAKMSIDAKMSIYGA